MNHEEFVVTVVSPDERIWEGKAYSISSENSAGKFDILPEHANFVTIIKNKPIVIRTENKKEQIFTYKNAVLAINNGKVAIYADI